MTRPKKYNTEAEYKTANIAAVQRYRRTERGKAVNNATQKKYSQSEKGKSHIKNRLLKQKHGITLDEYNQMFAEQQGCCVICNKHQSEFNQALHVDHNHETGKIRGLLCVNCNTGLGRFMDSQALLHKALAYLRAD